MTEEDNPFVVGDVINDSYKLIKCISQGTDQMIFGALNKSMKQIAIKLEKDSGDQTSQIQITFLNSITMVYI
ncbi:MAG: hypothetical protein EZS28_014643 [Streblomastix strix]|uniref:Protein kinase domain-containing protein n=1 Tax=Streblomastix strix TaxID=222440 RepID=A0A5J4W4G4_9EUKA|nr:MAG: hypothetical protein EZS28_050927 [Streblomastix strix]KAA6389831.1 MAG: hypothetical protein EZS28_014643 [Streblomastix strix]